MTLFNVTQDTLFTDDKLLRTIILSIADFKSLLAADATERSRREKLIHELSPVYELGTSIEGGAA